MTKRANLQIALLSGLIALGGTTLVAQNADKAEGGRQSHFVQLDTDMNLSLIHISEPTRPY